MNLTKFSHAYLYKPLLQGTFPNISKYVLKNPKKKVFARKALGEIKFYMFLVMNVGVYLLKNA